MIGANALPMAVNVSAKPITKPLVSSPPWLAIAVVFETRKTEVETQSGMIHRI